MNERSKAAKERIVHLLLANTQVQHDLTAGLTSLINNQYARDAQDQLRHKVLANSTKTGATSNIGNTSDGIAKNYNLYGPQRLIKCITNDCYDNGQRKFLVQWGDTYMYAWHIALHHA